MVDDDKKNKEWIFFMFKLDVVYRGFIVDIIKRFE